MAKGKIALMMNSNSYLVASIKEKFEADDYEVFSISTALKGFDDLIVNGLDAVLIYADEQLVNEVDGLVKLKDKALQNDIMLFAIGYKEDLEELEDSIPAQCFQKEFARPINVNEMQISIDEKISDNDNVLRKKILVVDDSGAMLRNVKGWLGDKYHVILASSGAMAIKNLALYHPDLVLLDYEMPIIDGKQVLEMIRTEDDFASVPVIFLTNRNDQESVMNVMGLSPDGYLLKSMEPSEIVKSIDAFFEKHGL